MHRPQTIPLGIAALFAVLLCAACGGGPPGGAAGPGQDDGAQLVGPWGETDREVSAAFNYFYLDTVNQQSGGRWTTANTAGQKAWVLSNTSFSTPKAWVIGQNYWNGENDELKTNLFSLPAQTSGPRLSFYSRWDIEADDFGIVEYRINGGSWVQLDAFSGGANPAYPAWTKYSYALPGNDTVAAQDWEVRFRFTSDSLGTGWGFGVDHVSVYQTKLNAPLNVAATDGTLNGEVEVSWSHNNAGTLAPSHYDVYRAPDNGGVPGTFGALPVGSVAYPATTYSDMTGNGDWFWYKIRARKAGYADSVDSAVDDGYGIGTWQTLTIDTDDALYTSLALIDGKPAIAYYDQAGGDLRYIYSSTATGSNLADWTDVLVDDGGVTNVGIQPCLALVNGKPAISYFDATEADLRYAFSSAANGAAGTWSDIGIETGIGSVGANSSIEIVGGNPAISYADGLADLRYAYSSTVGGTNPGDWTLVAVDGTGNPLTAQSTSLEVVNGFPGIAHGGNTPANLIYSFSSAVDGSTGTWSSIVVDATVGQAASVTLGLFGGKPAIAYQSMNLNKLRYAYSSTAGGTSASDWTALDVDADGTTGDYADMVAAYGKPAIGYQRNGFGDLKFAMSSAADGSSGWTNVTIDGDGAGPDSLGEYASTALINGKPAISYRDATNTALKFAWLD